ncbi:MAG: hypothetical protein M1819_006257 [Sarea resinae]|nr:MAG: hypothetical protein M1819_006257 [Sarea resinae]
MSTGNIIGGHKAAINNPHVSEEAKHHSKEVLEQEYEVSTESDNRNDENKDPVNVARGLKAAIHNPRVSEEAKEHSKQVLDEEYNGGNVGTSASVDSGEKDPANVARGLKAAISNPNVSDEAKENAEQRLKEMGA